MTSMLEQMARSAHTRARRFYTNMPPWEQMPKDAKDQGMAMASAMLEALLKPTDEMITAGVSARRMFMDELKTKGGDPETIVVAQHPAGTIFEAMIKAALEGK